MAKTITLPVQVTVNSVVFPVGSTANVVDAQAADIVQIVSRHNDMLSFVQKKTRGTFTDATSV
jgi:hypothetical protein